MDETYEAPAIELIEFETNDAAENISYSEESGDASPWPY